MLKYKIPQIVTLTRDCSVLRKVGTPILKALENITLKECTPSLFYWME